MSRYRRLRGVVHNLADKFARSCEHFAYLAMSRDVRSITVDLLGPSISPDQFSSERNLNLAKMCSADLRRYIASVAANPVQAAHVVATFQQGPETHTVEGRIEAIILDDRQRLWSAVAYNRQQALSP